MSLNVLKKPIGKKWYYNETVKDHFYDPRNIHRKSDPPLDYDGVGLVGSPACGDYMKMWVKIKDDKIVDCKWQTFGCASAIGSTSMLSVMITENGGMPIDDALALKPQDIIDRLGDLPARKVHCSVLGDKVLRSAVNDHFRRSKQEDRIISQPARMIDKVAKVTDHDIEEAVLEGAQTIEELQEKTKIGVGNPSVLQEAEQLMQFYIEKYFG